MTETKHTIHIPFELTTKEIGGILAQAFEGGSTYWCDELRGADDFHGTYSEAVANGYTIDVHDGDGGVWHSLNIDAFLSGYSKYIQGMGRDHRLEGIRPFDIDSERADAILQYSIFGKLIYG